MTYHYIVLYSYLLIYVKKNQCMVNSACLQDQLEVIRSTEASNSLESEEHSQFSKQLPRMAQSKDNLPQPLSYST